MAERIRVPEPDLWEEMRLTAKALSDLHHVLAVVVNNAKSFVPGESVDQLDTAWHLSESSIRVLAERFAPEENDQSGSVRALAERMSKGPAAQVSKEESQSYDLRGAELSGEVGQLKRSTLDRLKDSFFGWFYSEPLTKKKLAKAAGAASDYLDAAVMFVGSIPGAKESAVEIVALVRHLIGIRSKRKH